MNVWVNDAILAAAIADGGGGSDLVPSESNLSTGSSLDGFSSSRRSAWTWIECAIVSGSAQELFRPLAAARPPPPRRRSSSSSSPPSSEPGEEKGGGGAILAIRVIDDDNEHRGRVVEIARRHLGAYDVAMGGGGGGGGGGRGGTTTTTGCGGILPANSRGGNDENDDATNGGNDQDVVPVGGGGRGDRSSSRGRRGGGGRRYDDPDRRRRQLPSDLTQLAHLNEPTVVDCLHRRYMLGGWEMYTYSGPILIAINPCRTVSGLYDDDAMKAYWRWGERLSNGAASTTSTSTSIESGTAPPPPHVFAVADSAYRGMMRGLDFARSGTRGSKSGGEERGGVEREEEEDDGRVANQSVLVSGESGAGKTVTTKYIMQYLAALSKKVDGNDANVDQGDRRRHHRPAIIVVDARKGGNDDLDGGGRSATKSSIEQRVLQSNAILEAFGNARTLRNDNSSRFGKFIELRFTDRGRLSGASIDTYLLEKARLVGHTSGERTYHIFYGVLARGSLSQGERRTMYLRDMSSSDFALTTPSGGKDKSRLVHDGGYDDHARMFAGVRCAMDTMGFCEREQMDIVRAVCGLLHLSNMTLPSAFLDANDGEECALDRANPSLEPALHLLGVSYEALNASVTSVRFKAMDELLKKNLNASQAVRAVQALIKGAYDSIFSILVDRINSCIVGPTSEGEIAPEGDGAFIGLLDIFGFESFKTNSFEQLCINFCNESLQQQFNKFVFKLEQQEYMREGINWDMIEFEDNQDVLDLIERKHGGILTKLDEQCKLGMRCTDKTFVSAIYNTHLSTSKRFGASKKQQSQGKFSINHYAGVVEYDTTGFMEKNKDEMPMEASELFSNSTCAFIQNVAMNISSKMNGTQNGSRRNVMKSSISRVSVGGQFSSQLHKLRRRIDETHPHYVRCLKPNDQLQPDRIDLNIVVDQLRCGGILEAIRVSRAGFPHRYNFYHFYSRFGILSSSLTPDGDIKRSQRPRVVRKLNRGDNPATPAKRNFHVGKKQRIDPKKGCEILVKVIARWILSERNKNMPVENHENAEDSLSPRTFWKSKSPHKLQRDNNVLASDCSEAGIQLGTTKVFLLQDTFDSIERLRGQILAFNATKITSLARKYLARRAYLLILRSLRESKNRRSLRGGSIEPSETKTEDNSESQGFEIKLELFRSKSSFDRGGSVASSEQVYDWISIGHGRFVKRECSIMSQEFDADCISL